MNILLLNDGYFLDSLRRQGNSVFFASASPQADLKVGSDPIPIGTILRRCPFEPDVVLLSDSINYRAAFVGLEELDLPLAFFGVDAPMNGFWQRDVCLAFDVAFLDQRGPVEELQAAHPEQTQRFRWLPLGADSALYHKRPIAKQYDIAFVGSLHPVLRPKRYWLLKTLQRHFKVDIFDGGNQRSLTPETVAQIYNQSRIVLNENLFPGLNLRLIEAMSCGACLLTEESDRSWDHFFSDGEHLVSFNSENILERTADLLQNCARRERIADTGMELVQSQHTIDHRAQTLVTGLGEALKNARPGHLAQRRFHLGRAYLSLASRWPDQPGGKMTGYALYLLEEAARLGAHQSDVYFELTAQALKENRRMKAGGWLDKALESDPHHWRSIWTSFWRWRELGDHQAAAAEIVRLRQTLGLETPRKTFYENLLTEQDLSAGEYIELGKILESAGWSFAPGIERSAAHPCRWNAFDAYQKALALAPQLSEPYLRCALLMERSGCEEFALPFIEKVAKLDPENAAVRLRFSRLLLRNYRREEGCEQLLQYLCRSSEADKWDQAEALRLSQTEWHDVLAALERPQILPMPPSQVPESAC